MSLNFSKHAIHAALVVVGVAITAQIVFAQSTPPPRATPTLINQSTPARSTPTPLGTPDANGTPLRPTPTTASAIPARATPTRQAKPEKKQPEATPAATPELLPTSGAPDLPAPSGQAPLLVAIGLVIIGGGLSAVAYRRRH